MTTPETSALTADTIELDDDPEALYELSLEQGWGDGVPILPPTDARIEALLAATPHPPDHIVGVLPPRNGVATVELAATNAAMAGVEPAAFPLVLAALEAISTPEWNAFALTTTTSTRLPDADRERPESRRARHQLPRRLPRRRRGPRLDDDRPRRLVMPAQRRRTEGRRDLAHRLRPARPLRPLLRRVGGALAVAVPRRAPRPRAPTRTSSPSTAARARSPSPTSTTTAPRTSPTRSPSRSRSRSTTGTSSRRARRASSCSASTRSGRSASATRSRRSSRSRSTCSRTRGSRSSSGGRGTRRSCRDKGRVDAKGRVMLVERPEQLVPVVCGGLGSLHAVALTSFCESEMQSVAALRK